MSDVYTFTDDGTDTTITNWSILNGEINIQITGQLFTHPVTTIGDNAFYNQNYTFGITGLDFP